MYCRKKLIPYIRKLDESLVIFTFIAENQMKTKCFMINIGLTTRMYWFIFLRMCDLTSKLKSIEPRFEKHFITGDHIFEPILNRISNNAESTNVQNMSSHHNLEISIWQASSLGMKIWQLKLQFLHFCNRFP